MDSNDKKTFRKDMLARRAAIPTEQKREADNARNERIRSWNEYQKAELLLFYAGYRSEADTIQLIEEALDAGRAVAVPKVVGDDMIFYRIADICQLVKGYRGIPEPDTALMGVVPVDFSKIVPEKTVLFLPGCAFDRNGGRMGYGGGFYDRFVEKYPEIMRVALAYEVQLVEKVPRETHDKPVDMIVTEERIIRTVL